MSVRTRFAPSPTGFLHIGGVRTALFNWLLARQAGGQFILRIDDTDADRNVAAALRPILAGFQWLGLDWDEGPTPDGGDSHGPHGPYFQSQRGDLYQAAAKQLLATGCAYRDYSRPEELQTQRDAARQAGKTFVYDRQWMATTDEQAQQFESEGRSATVRLKMPREGTCRFHDLVRGDMEVQWSDEQDHVIQRADGSCLYHLATVVDDQAMGITHVVRAEEHLSNTARQIFIGSSLGYEIPTFAHLPVVAEPGGTAKISKRKLDKYEKNKDFATLQQLGSNIAQQIGLDKDRSLFNPIVVDFYESIGCVPQGILNYLLLLGWSLDDSTEEFSQQDMLQHFSLERVNKAPASFDPQKLLSFQTRWMLKLSPEQRAELCLPFLTAAGVVPAGTLPEHPSHARLLQVIAAADDRIKMGGDILSFQDFFVDCDALHYDAAAVEKRLKKDPDAVDRLRRFRDQLRQLTAFEPSDVEDCLKAFVASEEIKFNQIIHALRVATTGKAVGFGMFESMSILGQDECLARIDRALTLV